MSFYHLKNPKIKILKIKKFAGDIIACACVPKITILWYTFPEIDSEKDMIFCNFGPFFALLPPYRPSPLPNNPGNQNFVNDKKKFQEILSFYTLHVYHTWKSYWVIFWIFSPLATWKINIFTLKNTSLETPENQNFCIKRNTWRFYHFTHLIHKWQSYNVWFLRYGSHQTIFCHSEPLF